MGLFDEIKQDVKKAGQTKSDFIYFRPDEKVRIRFLNDLEDGMKVVFHDHFDRKINVPCQETFGKKCSYCNDDTLRTRNMYIWSVWNYEQEKVQLFMFAVNNCSPIPPVTAMYETYGTITDRDYVITCVGKGKDKSYTVVPMDKSAMKTKAKAFSEKQIYEMLQKAYPADDADTDDDSWDDDDSSEYDDMSVKDLYKLCKDRDIEAEPKKKKPYYIHLLKEADKADEDWGDESDTGDDDGWD